ncbi:MAG: PQQ-binding-like beta-propeller repeat protein [Candidatus Hinthialibacter antarcticus]|nr:PQQ-binding-like beta-propeller repeat protein [Candidatus Hinthialibacter antarcticus]
MNTSLTGKIASTILAAAGILSILFWLSASSPYSLEHRVPGMDKSQNSAASERSRTGPAGLLTKSDGVPSELTGEWPCFRGVNFDNISQENFKPIAKDGGFEELWGLEVGEGFAGAVVKHGRVYLMDYDRDNKEDALRCLSLDDGKEIWRYTYPVNVKRNHGMSRTAPYVTDDVVISLGPKCHVSCLDAKSGEKKWSLDLVFAYGTEVPPWYAGQNPLVDNGRLILAPSGSALMVALDIETGETIWETPNPNQWEMTHSSITPMEFNGQRTYIYCASGGVTGVSAEDGSILWETPDWTIRMANVPSPLVIDENRVFFSGGYGAGAMMMKLSVSESNGSVVPEILFKLENKQFGSTQHTPILFQNHIIGVRPDGQLVCLDFDGNEVWASSPAYKFGLGPYMIAGQYIYVMDDEGLLSRVEARTDEFHLVDQTQVLHGHESWAPIALASGRMILRDLTQMVCIAVAAD